MPIPPATTPQRRTRSITMSLTEAHFSQAVAAAQVAGLTPSELTHREFVRALQTLAAPPQLGPEYAQLFLEEILTLRAFLEESLQRSIPGAAPLTKDDLRALNAAIAQQKSMGAKSLLNRLTANRPLPLPKG